MKTILLWVLLITIYTGSVVYTYRYTREQITRKGYNPYWVDILLTCAPGLNTFYTLILLLINARVGWFFGVKSKPTNIGIN